MGDKELNVELRKEKAYANYCKHCESNKLKPVPYAVFSMELWERMRRN